MIRSIAIVLMLGLLVGCDARPEYELENVEDWMALYEARDFFRLRDELRRIESGTAVTPRVSFLRAAMQHSFNRPVESNATIDALLLRDDVRGDLLKDALFLRLNNFVRLYHYADAAQVTGELLALDEPALGDGERNNVENIRRLMNALSDVPPQEIVTRGATVLNYGTDGRIAVRIEGDDYRIPFDTGANLSLLMRSEVERLGLEIRPAGIEVGTSTDKKVYADLSVADSVEIGRLEYRNVVFLVFPDELLTFPNGHVIEGLVGFPLIEAMGEVRFRHDGFLEIPEQIPARNLRNLALDQLELLVRVGFEGEGLLCRFDTGADDTSFYEPFFRHRRGMFETLEDPVAVESAGVGGIRSLTAYVLPSIEVEVGGAPVTMSDVEVYTTPITDGESNDLHCNIGRTAMAGFDEYTINFRSMSLIAVPSR